MASKANMLEDILDKALEYDIIIQEEAWEPYFFEEVSLGKTREAVISLLKNDPKLLGMIRALINEVEDEDEDDDDEGDEDEDEDDDEDEALEDC